MPLGKVIKKAHGQWLTGKVKVSGAAPATPPTLLTAVVPTAGTTIVLTFTVPSSPLLPASGITGLTATVAGSNATFSSAMTSSTVITLTMDTTVYVGQVVTVSYAPGNITDSAPTVLASFGPTSVTNNSTTAAPYVNASCLLFNGSTGIVKVLTNQTGQDFTSTMTFNIWMKSSTTGATYDTTLLDKSFPDRPGYWLPVAASTSKIAAWFLNNVSTYVAYDSSVSVFNGSWHMITGVYNAGTVTIYIDGTADASKSVINNSGNVTIGHNSTALTFGGRNATTPTGFYTGRLTNASIWNIALNSTQVNQLKVSSKPADLSSLTFFSNCKGWYKLGDGDATGAGNVLDSSGLTYHASIVGGVTIDSDHP